MLPALIAQVVPAPWLGEGALAGLASFMLAAFLNEWIVSGKMYRQAKEEAAKRLTEEQARHAKELETAQREIEYWRGLAMESLGHAERAVEQAGKLVEARR